MNPQRFLLFLLLVVALALSACGGATAEPTVAPPTKAPEPTEPKPTETPEPTRAPEPTEEVAEPTAVPPTETPEPAEPEPTETPEPPQAPEEPTQAPEPTEEVTANIVDSAFEDSTITVPVGTTVIWTHNGRYPHTVTADDGSFDSDTLNNGATFSYTFDQAGTYAYYCKIHGGPGGTGMSGTVIVTE